MNVSDRKAAEILQSTVVGNGQDLNKTPISYSTIRRKRNSFREKIALEIKSSFKPPQRVVVHFDGKLLSDLSGNFGDRLAIMVSGNSPQCLEGFLISANLIENGTGESQANEVIASLNDWNLLKFMVAICFDTCSANTGWFKGAAVRIEQAVERPLLWLPCRKHIMELILKAVFCEVFGDNLSPYYEGFEDFRHIFGCLMLPYLFNYKIPSD